MSEETEQAKDTKPVRRWVVPLALFIGFFGLYMFTTSIEGPLTGDGMVMVVDAQHILDHGFNPEVVGTSPRLSKYQLGQPLLDMVIVPLRRRATMESNQEKRVLLLLGVSTLPAALGALTCVLAYLCVLRLGLRRLTAVLAAMLIGLTSMIWCYTQTLFADPTLGMLWVLAFYGCLRFRGSRHWGWLCLTGAAGGYAVLTKITAGSVLIVFSVYVLWLVLQRQRRPDAKTVGWLAAFGVPVLIGIFVMLWYNHLRFDHWLAFGYMRDAGGAVQSRDQLFGFNVPLLTGLYGLLLSSGKGVFWYNPTLLLMLVGLPLAWRRARSETVVCLAVFLAVLLFHAKWWAWHGDRAWGPRFLIAGLPMLYLPSAFWLDQLVERFRQRERRWRLSHILVAAVIVLSLCVQFAGLSIYYDNYLKLATVNTRFFPHALYETDQWPIRNDTLQSHFIPEFSPLIGHWWMMKCIWNRNSQQGAECRRRPPWAGLNPLWVPSNYIVEKQFHWDIWWAFSWQMRDRLGVNMWLFGGLAGCFLVFACGGLGIACRLSVRGSK